MKKVCLLAIPFMTLSFLVSCGGGGRSDKEWYSDTKYINSLTNKDIGLEKSIVVNGLDHKVRLIGIDHDPLASGNGNAHTTWEFANLLSDKNGYSLATPWDWTKGTESNNHDFLNSNLRKALDGQGNGAINWYEKKSATQSTTYKAPVIDMIPSKLKEVLKEVKKPVKLYDEGKKTYYVNEEKYVTKMFSLSASEMTDGTIGAEIPVGTQYEFYKGKGDSDSTRIKWQIKHHEGAETDPTEIIDHNAKNSPMNFAGFNNADSDKNGGMSWLRSPAEDDQYSFVWFVNVNGKLEETVSCQKAALPVAPAFCL